MTEYEQCPHGRHVGAVCIPCVEKMYADTKVRPHFTAKVDPLPRPDDEPVAQHAPPVFRAPDEWLPEKYPETEKPAVENSKKTEQRTGGDSKYYDLPTGCKTLQDIIYRKEMDFSRGNIFKATYRWDEKPNLVYNLEKIIWFAAYLLEKLQPGASMQTVTSAVNHSKLD